MSDSWTLLPLLRTSWDLGHDIENPSLACSPKAMLLDLMSHKGTGACDPLGFLLPSGTLPQPSLVWLLERWLKDTTAFIRRRRQTLNNEADTSHSDPTVYQCVDHLWL